MTTNVNNTMNQSELDNGVKRGKTGAVAIDGMTWPITERSTKNTRKTLT